MLHLRDGKYDDNPNCALRMVVPSCFARSLSRREVPSLLPTARTMPTKRHGTHATHKLCREHAHHLYVFVVVVPCRQKSAGAARPETLTQSPRRFLGGIRSSYLDTSIGWDDIVAGSPGFTSRTRATPGVPAPSRKFRECERGQPTPSL